MREENFVKFLLGSTTILLAAFAGIVMAFVFWRRAPRAALLVLIACIVQFVASALNAWVQANGLWTAEKAGLGLGSVPRLTEIGFVLRAWEIRASVLHAITTGLLIWAAFSGRAKDRSSPPLLR